MGDMFKSILYIEPDSSIESIKTKKRYLVKWSVFKSIIKDGEKYCAWCGKNKISGRKKYCSEDCITSSDIFARPQSLLSRKFLLEKQDYKCACCGFDYKEHIKNIMARYKTQYKQVHLWVLKALYLSCGKDRVPEVDHILAITNGGSSIGLDNLRVLCYKCHKEKTKTERKLDKPI